MPFREPISQGKLPPPNLEKGLIQRDVTSDTGLPALQQRLLDATSGRTTYLTINFDKLLEVQWGLA